MIASGKVGPNDDDKSPPPNEQTILAAFKDTDTDILVEYKETLGAIIGNLADFESTLAEKIIESGASISFSGLRNTLTEMEAFLKKQLQGRIPEEQTDPDQAQASSQAGGMPAAGSGNTPKPSGIEGINSRQDVILVLDRICKYYQLYEPGSPVPMLLKRARQLVEKDFLEIIQDLAPDSADKIKNLISGPEKEATPSK
jgi:type VI secretion system protein ImpA